MKSHFLKWTEDILETGLLLPFVQQAGRTTFFNNTRATGKKKSSVGQRHIGKGHQYKEKQLETSLLVTVSMEAENRPIIWLLRIPEIARRENQHSEYSHQLELLPSAATSLPFTTDCFLLPFKNLKIQRKKSSIFSRAL